MHYNYLIVGTGLFGAVFAHEMTKQGKNCLVIDKRSHLAGNIYTKEERGIRVHWYGAHIFHTSNKEVWNYINQFAEFNHYINSPIALYKDELYNLPFNMNTFSKLWGIRTPEEATKKMEEQIADLGITDPQNLEEQALSLVGKDIYEKLVKGYTEKQWGRDCKELPAFIIKRIPVRFTYDNNYFNDPFQGIPKGGYTSIVEKLLLGSEVRLETSYQKFLEANEKADEKERITYDKVIYTGMIDEFYDYCLGELEYRSLEFVHETLIGTENHQGNAVVNYTEREVPYTRVIEHKHFEFGKQPDTVISREYPRDWSKGDEPYYPVNNDKNNKLFEEYRVLAKKDDKVLFGGRLGQYRYYDMDKVIEAALEMVKDQATGK